MARNNSQKLRQRIAEEAARIVLEEGVRDYQRAKTKASERLGLWQTRDLPSHADIEQAVVLRRRLFAQPSDGELLRYLRESAIGLMRLLSEFDARLVGSVLKGTANQYSEIELHLFADDLKMVAIRLLDVGIRYQSIERGFSREGRESIPGFAFNWQNVPIEALVFERSGLRIAPNSLVDGKPMRRASMHEVQALLEAEAGDWDVSPSI